MDLLGGVVDEKYASARQNYVIARKAMAENRKQRFGQANNPSDEQQEDKLRDQGQRLSKKPCFRLQLGRKFADENRDHDKVIDTQRRFRVRSASAGSARFAGRLSYSPFLRASLHSLRPDLVALPADFRPSEKAAMFASVRMMRAVGWIYRCGSQPLAAPEDDFQVRLVSSWMKTLRPTQPQRLRPMAILRRGLRFVPAAPQGRPTAPSIERCTARP